MHDRGLDGLPERCPNRCPIDLTGNPKTLILYIEKSIRDSGNNTAVLTAVLPEATPITLIRILQRATSTNSLNREKESQEAT